LDRISKPQAFSFIKAPVLPSDVPTSLDDEMALDEIVDGFAAEYRVWRKRREGEYDVFLCHNSEDKPDVRALGNRLKRKGYLPWLDEWNLQPGASWQNELQERIESIRSAAVIVGPSGIGPWQRVEIAAILQEFLRNQRPVIPVILPSAAGPPKLPVFLGDRTWIDFRKIDPDPVLTLIWGITGRAPP
jgi:hypothetical protein